jgi:hypothetical protein
MQHSAEPRESIQSRCREFKMTAQSPGRADPSEYSLPLDPIAFPQVRGLAPEGDPIEASSQLRADLLDTMALERHSFDVWPDNENGHYHMVDRWSPTEGVARELGLLLAHDFSWDHAGTE